MFSVMEALTFYFILFILFFFKKEFPSSGNNFIFFINLFIYSFIFGCVGSPLLPGATLGCGVQASHCGGFSCCGAQAIGTWASVVVARGL